jgi:hypothetical protein
MRPRTWLRAAALGVACGIAARVPASEPPSSPSTELPEGEGKAIAVASCLQCHAAKTLAHQRKDRAAWEATVYDMVGKGAQLLPDEIDPLVAYLAAHFSPEAARATSVARETKTKKTATSVPRRRP